jgi:heme exporter protein CcmD
VNPSSLFDLSGHGYFIWASYGMLALAIAFELVLLRRRRHRNIMQARAILSEAPARAVLVTPGSKPKL